MIARAESLVVLGIRARCMLQAGWRMVKSVLPPIAMLAPAFRATLEQLCDASQAPRYRGVSRSSLDPNASTRLHPFGLTSKRISNPPLNLPRVARSPAFEKSR